MSVKLERLASAFIKGYLSEKAILERAQKDMLPGKITPDGLKTFRQFFNKCRFYTKDAEMLAKIARTVATAKMSINIEAMPIDTKEKLKKKDEAIRDECIRQVKELTGMTYNFSMSTTKKLRHLHKVKHIE